MQTDRDRKHLSGCSGMWRWGGAKRKDYEGHKETLCSDGYVYLILVMVYTPVKIIRLYILNMCSLL